MVPVILRFPLYFVSTLTSSTQVLDAIMDVGENAVRCTPDSDLTLESAT